MPTTESSQINRFTPKEIVTALVILICVSAYPALYLLAHNLENANPGEVFVLLALIVLSGLAVAVILLLLSRNLYISVIITTVLIILFFSYGHVFGFLTTVQNVFFQQIARDRILIPIWGAFLAAVVVGCFKLKSYLERMMPALVLFAATLIAPLLFQIGWFYSHAQAPIRYSGLDSAGSFHPAVEPLPDVYYIILDGYGRADVLEQNFDFDNGEFIRALEQRGFYVADDSYSNYPETLISLSSSLNMEYHDLAYLQDERISARTLYQYMIEWNAVADAFIALGYKYSPDSFIIHDLSQANGLKTAPPLELEYTEVFYLMAKSSILSVMERHLPETEAALPAEPSLDDAANETNPQSTRGMNIIQGHMKKVSDTAHDENPTFVYAHFLSPHPPYEFTTSPFEGEASSWDSTPWFDHEAYVREVKALNQVVLQTIDDILARSDTPPIIILQGDHGPATKFYEAELSWQIPARRLAKKMTKDVRVERFAILNAYYGPDEMKANLYPSISPVNSFCVVLNYISDHHCSLLPDRSFMATYTKPIEYIEFPELHDQSSN